MDVLGMLLLLVGSLVGVLLALMVDGYRLGRRVEAALADRDRLQTTLRQLGSRLASTQRRLQELNEELRTNHYQLGQVAGKKEVAHQELATAETEVERLRADKEQVCQQLAVTEVEIRHLQQELADAQKQAEQVVQLRLEKQELEDKLEEAEVRLNEAKSRILNVIRQLNETQSLRKQLVVAEARLKAAEARINTLQSSLDVARSQLRYTGTDERLQIIRGIGPTYARRLHEAGVTTLSELAQMTPERVRQIVGLKPWQAAEPETWITEASQLAAALNGEEASSADRDSQPATGQWQSDQ